MPVCTICYSDCIAQKSNEGKFVGLDNFHHNSSKFSIAIIKSSFFKLYSLINYMLSKVYSRSTDLLKFYILALYGMSHYKSDFIFIAQV